MKKIGVVEFLEWAFNEELPKGGGGEGISSVRSAWGRIMRWSELMTTVYQGAGTMEFFDRGGDPHPDALLAGQAVAALADVTLNLPLDWNPLEAQSMTPAARAAVDEAIHRIRGDHRDGVALRLLPVGIIVRCAVMRRLPDFAKTIIVRERMVMNGAKPAWFVRRKGVDAFGREVMIEIDGYNPKTGHPVPGAYRKYEMPPEIVGDIAGRAEWQLWRAAIDMVFEDLAGNLADHVLEPCQLPLEPWIEGLPDRNEPVIRPDMRPLKRSFSNAKSKGYTIKNQAPFTAAQT